MPPHSLVESAPAVALWAPLQGARLRGQGVATKESERGFHLLISATYNANLPKSSGNQPSVRETKQIGNLQEWFGSTENTISKGFLGSKWAEETPKNAKTCKKDFC